MSQALAPFSQRAGVASSLLGISHVSFSAAYIWLMGALGINALNILIFILVLGSIASCALLLLERIQTTNRHYEESSQPS
jgi:DHA1 family multidrug resistance protein-like MFS transporter